jgi:hypothetical protein
MADMYVRFVTPVIDPDSRVECGFFQAAWYLETIGCSAWIQHELDREFAWFRENLPVPRTLARHFVRRDSLHGVCWFRPSARECIRRSHYCAWLFSEAGLPVEMLRLRRARDIIWSDNHQIVTLARTGRAFRGAPLRVDFDGAAA